MNGSFILLLHAHLPYVKHPEHEYSLEENWLFEAIRETYIPLLDMLEGIINDGIIPNITFSISPTLTEMLNDQVLRQRFVRYLDNLIELAEAEISRTKGSPFGPVALFYHDTLKRGRQLYLERYKQDLTAAFRKLQDEGHIEILTTSATHAFLPAYEHYPEAVKSQIKTGVESYTRNFGRPPDGFWLPECGYYTGLDHLLKEAGIRYFFMESHGIIHGSPRPGASVYRPVFLSSGLRAIGRDARSSQQVWCAESGYPGDPFYRDFYRDIGFDLPPEYIERFTHFKGIRTFTGLKYHRITGKSDEKLPYERAIALEKTKEHALHFLDSRDLDFQRLSGFGFGPIVLSAFDAELFGHWWFEGVEWLDAVIRSAAARKSFRIVTPREYFDVNASCPLDIIEPSPSTWGEGGHNAFWIGEKNRHLYRHIHNMAENIVQAAEDWKRIKKLRKNISKRKIILTERVLSQAKRELFLAQSSDWFFLMQKERASGYAERRVLGHIERFNRLLSMIKQDAVDDGLLSEMEMANGIFPWIKGGNYDDRRLS